MKMEPAPGNPITSAMLAGDEVHYTITQLYEEEHNGGRLMRFCDHREVVAARTATGALNCQPCAEKTRINGWLMNGSTSPHRLVKGMKVIVNKGFALGLVTWIDYIHAGMYHDRNDVRYHTGDTVDVMLGHWGRRSLLAEIFEPYKPYNR